MISQPDKTLDQMSTGQPCTVSRLVASPHDGEWVRQLEELGFIPGERVTIMASGWPGGDPLVVRVGLSTFALRRAEAACVGVIAITGSAHE